MKKALLLAPLLLILSSNNVQAHCQIPCGVFDDQARFEKILENAKTIEKAMNKIIDLGDDAKPDYHTISRWTATKEEHAQDVQDIAAQYFLAQRVKSPKADADEATLDHYTKQLIALHEITIAAMKAKHTTDTTYVAKLRDLTEAYRGLYFKEHGHTH